MDSKQAAAYVIDPLYGPQAHEETGLNTHFRSTFAPRIQEEDASSDPPAAQQRHVSRETNPFRRSMDSDAVKGGAAVSARPLSGQGRYPTPPSYAGSYQSTSNHSHRRDFSGSSVMTDSSYRSRASSLGERFPGDQTHKPLDMIRRDSKRAHRSPHLRRHHIPGADTIDRLDQVNGMYHHEGPYDAALLARNTSYDSSPVAAVEGTLNEAIRATPRENIIDAVERHRPLDGVAVIPPGETDRFGRKLHYKEGDNMMIVNGGNYKRWADIDYHPDDIKGKGEPNFSIDRALKEHKARGGDPSEGIELVSRQRSNTVDHDERPKKTTGRDVLEDLNQDIPKRSSSMGGKMGEGLKRRLSFIRRRVAS